MSCVIAFLLAVLLCRSTNGNPAPSTNWDDLKATWSLPKAVPGILAADISYAFRSIGTVLPETWDNSIRMVLDNLPKLPTDKLAKVANGLLPQFPRLPRTYKESALERGWTMLDADCDGGPFMGTKHVLNGDRTLTLLMDINGYIAGLQSSIPTEQFKPAEPLRDTYYIHDGDYWTQTVYFMEPSKICDPGRGDPAKEGTGFGLWIQNGPDPRNDVMNIPLEEDAAAENGWNGEKCYPTMGTHRWFNLTSDMNCDQFVPFCLLFNGHKLTGFCFAKNTQWDGQTNFNDFPPPSSSQYPMFFDPVPQCFARDHSYEELRTIHVYFKSDAETASNCQSG